MDPLGKQELLNFYNRHLRDFGDTPQAVRWTPEGQIRRYETLLTATGDLSGKTILDFGCGKGDLYGFLRDKGVAVSYCGIDVNDNLIELAQHKYPQAEFIALDIDEDTFHRRFDVIIAIGVFNLRIAGIEESMKGLLKKLFPLCRESLHINFLTYYVPRRSVELFYVRPEEILEFAITEISRTVTVRHVKEDVFLSVYTS
ncbi:MAG TPA: class I SAM-dependent methyltransferase [Thermodesulfovibrionales bacterium]|jgi:SAM-dependent methyltransferase|nr:class I SAM-dependent methyltransferase [Thermodesulfovibrionales bacterium]